MRITLTAVSLLATIAVAQAEPATARRPQGPPCRPFMQRYCKDAQWGGGRRIACLAKHKEQLNDSCREKLEVMQQLFELTQKNLAANRKASKGTKNNPDGQDAKSAKAARPK